jgi:hypothetical protein
MTKTPLPELIQLYADQGKIQLVEEMAKKYEGQIDSNIVKSSLEKVYRGKVDAWKEDLARGHCGFTSEEELINNVNKATARLKNIGIDITQENKSFFLTYYTKLFKQHYSEMYSWVRNKHRVNDYIPKHDMHNARELRDKIQELGGEVIPADDLNREIYYLSKEVVDKYKNGILQIVKKGWGHTVLPGFPKLLSLINEVKEEEQFLSNRKKTAFKTKYTKLSDIFEKIQKEKKSTEEYFDSEQYLDELSLIPPDQLLKLKFIKPEMVYDLYSQSNGPYKTITLEVLKELKQKILNEQKEQSDGFYPHFGLYFAEYGLGKLFNDTRLDRIQFLFDEYFLKDLKNAYEEGIEQFQNFILKPVEWEDPLTGISDRNPDYKHFEKEVEWLLKIARQLGVTNTFLENLTEAKLDFCREYMQMKRINDNISRVVGFSEFGDFDKERIHEIREARKDIMNRQSVKNMKKTDKMIRSGYMEITRNVLSYYQKSSLDREMLEHLGDITSVVLDEDKDILPKKTRNSLLSKLYDFSKGKGQEFLKKRMEGSKSLKNTETYMQFLKKLNSSDNPAYFMKFLLEQRLDDR